MYSEDLDLLLLITPQMVDHYKNRTENHINLVKKYGEKVGQDFTFHDIDKFYAAQMIPYIIISWMKVDKSFAITERQQQALNQATFRHVKGNAHHPEFWSDQQQVINQNNRDEAPLQAIECSAMPEYAIIEMCADWCAMSEELGNSPFDWFEKTNQKRWKWTADQCRLINEYLNKMWNN